MQAFTTLFALPASLWSDQPLWFTTKLPLVNIPSTACMCACDLWLQREAEPHKEIEPYRVNWLQGIPHCLPQPCLPEGRGPQSSPWVLIVQAESDFIDRVCMRHHHVEAILREKEAERDVVSKRLSAHKCSHASHWSVLECIRASSILLALPVPGSSWSLSGTWCKHARRLFGSRDGSSWWFCCWKLSRSCNRQKLDFFFNLKFGVTVASFMYFKRASAHRIIFQVWQRQNGNYRDGRLTRKNVWGCRCIVGEAQFPCWCYCGWSTCCYVLHIHFFIQFITSLHSVS